MINSVNEIRKSDLLVDVFRDSRQAFITPEYSTSQTTGQIPQGKKTAQKLYRKQSLRLLLWVPLMTSTLVFPISEEWRFILRVENISSVLLSNSQQLEVAISWYVVDL